MTIRRCLHQLRSRYVTAALLVPFFATSAVAGGGGYVPSGIAQSEILRRQERVAQGNAAYERGVRAGKTKDYATAYDELSLALELLPYGESTEAHRQVYTEAYVKYATIHAGMIAENGRADEARDIVDSVLAVEPDHRLGNELLKGLDAGEFANIPQHANNVERVNTLLRNGRSSYELDKFDEAVRAYREVLRIDRYNTAARRGLEAVANEKMKYHEEAYRHTRGAFIRLVDEQWEMQVPPADREGGIDVGGLASDGGLGYITAKLNRIILPRTRMNGFTLESAINYVRETAREVDNIEGDPAKKGINILIDERKINSSSPGALEARIELDLPPAPLAEVLRYICEFAGVKPRYEPYAVIIVPLTDSSEALFTRRYRVPPSFTSMGDGGGSGGVAEDDPFAEATAEEGGLSRKANAKDILTGKGIKFDQEGSTAFYISAASELVVRNTQSQLDIVDQFIQALIDEGVPRQVKVETKFVEVQQDNLNEFGFDWVLGARGLDKVLLGGGSVGTSERAFGSAQFPFFGQNAQIPGSNPLNPVSAGLRSGSEAISQSAIQALVAAGRVGAVSEIVNPAPGIFSVAGVLTNPQFQVVLRALDQKKGTDLLSAPSILTRNGQPAQVEVIRELIYPTEYDPPELPQEFGTTVDLGDGGGLPIDPANPVAAAPPASFPVTPATPTAFATRNTGVTLKVTPQVGPDGYTIEMDLLPEVVEFEGFVNYGSPITTGGVDILGNPVRIVLTENRIEMPVFSTRRVTTNVTVYDGSTVAIGGLIREDVQHTQDKLPIFGDLPVVGRLFRIEAEERKKRNLMVFVTATLIDPAGQPLRDYQDEEEEVGLDGSLFPPADVMPPVSYGGK